eukprot:COSAG02_NODE_200_length_29507_cov_440.183487_12_plen_122_part_00
MKFASGSSMRFMVKDAPVPPATVPTAPASSASQTSERSPGAPLLLMPLGAKRKIRLPSVYAVRVPGVVHWAKQRRDGVNEQGNCCNAGFCAFRQRVGGQRHAAALRVLHGAVHACAANAHY